MDIQELIDTLNNVADKSADIMVHTGDAFVVIDHVRIGSAGVSIEAPVPVTSMDYPSVLLETADVDFNWPDGVRVKDRDGDIYTHKAGKWAWTETSSGVKRAYDGIDDGYMIKSYLPATVI